MRRPHLNRALVLEASVRQADGAGGFTETWQPLGTVWAEVAPVTGRKALGDGGDLGRQPVKITLRAFPEGATERPVPGQRLRQGSRAYMIFSVCEADRAGRYLMCRAEAEVVL